MGSRRPHGSASGSSGTDGRVTGMVSKLLRVPEPLDDWLPEVGPLEELEPGWDWDWDFDCDGDWVEKTWDGDWVD